MKIKFEKGDFVLLDFSYSERQNFFIHSKVIGKSQNSYFFEVDRKTFLMLEDRWHYHAEWESVEENKLLNGCPYDRETLEEEIKNTSWEELEISDLVDYQVELDEVALLDFLCDELSSTILSISQELNS